MYYFIDGKACTIEEEEIDTYSLSWSVLAIAIISFCSYFLFKRCVDPELPSM